MRQRTRVNPHRTPHGTAATRARSHSLMSAGGDNRRVLGHLGINVPKLAATQQDYASLLPLVGLEPFLTAEHLMEEPRLRPGFFC